MGQDPLKATHQQAERLHRFAHDLKNRLAAMQQVLQQFKGTDPEGNELIGFGEQQFFKALRSTEQLLDDLAVDRSVGPMERTSVDLTALVRDAISSLAHRFERKHQTVHTALAAHLPVAADAHWAKEAVLAVLSNASKFSPAGSTIDVALEHEHTAAVLRITDHGVGLSATDLEQIFTRYAWLESRSTDGEPQGRSTLARAKQWIEAQGGRLEASSAGPGKGASFTVRLPLGA